MQRVGLAVQNKAYGLVTVSTSKSYAVNFVDRNNKTTSIAVKNPSEQDKIITTVHENAPYIICGYNEDILTAVTAAAYINGRAGELAEKKTNCVSMIASDTVSCIPEAITELLNTGE